MVRVDFSACLPLIKAAKPLGSRERSGRHLIRPWSSLDVGVTVTWRPFAVSDQIGGEGDNMADYEQVTEDIREGLAKITKEGKSIEIIMKEILAVLTETCEQHKLDKLEFIQAFYEWYKERRG